VTDDERPARVYPPGAILPDDPLWHVGAPASLVDEALAAVTVKTARPYKKRRKDRRPVSKRKTKHADPVARLDAKAKYRRALLRERAWQKTGDDIEAQLRGAITAALEAGMTWAELAEWADVSKVTVARWAAAVAGRKPWPAVLLRENRRRTD
jgi:hypothetical protein